MYVGEEKLLCHCHPTAPCTPLPPRVWRGAVMQQHLRKACGGKFKFFCPVGGKTSRPAGPLATFCPRQPSLSKSYYWPPCGV